jgi:acetyl-CoA acyltransferase 1
VTQDEGIRPNTTMEALKKLKPAFKQGGSTTAGTHALIFLYLIGFQGVSCI